MIYADIEYSKKLADEFPDSEWWWVPDMEGDKYWVVENIKYISMYKKEKLEHYPALTTDVLLERLPYIIRNVQSPVSGFNNDYILGLHKRSEDWLISYGMAQEVIDKSLPNALALMTIWLKEKGELKCQ